LFHIVAGCGSKVEVAKYLVRSSATSKIVIISGNIVINEPPYKSHLGSSTAANWVSFDLNVSCSSCWGYSLVNTLKLKKKKKNLNPENGLQEWQQTLSRCKLGWSNHAHTYDRSVDYYSERCARERPAMRAAQAKAVCGELPRWCADCCFYTRRVVACGSSRVLVFPAACCARAKWIGENDNLKSVPRSGRGRGQICRPYSPTVCWI